MVWVAEAYGFDSPTLMGYLAAKTETAPDRRGHPQRLLAHPRRAAADRGRARQRLRRPRRARPRRLGPAGHRGVPRAAVRQAAGPHPRGHPDHPLGPEARAAGVARHLRHPAVGGPGARPRQAAEDPDPARARHRADLGRLARRQERPDDRRARRRLAADPLHPRAGRATSGATRSPPARPSATPSSVRCRSAPAAWSRSARTSRGCSTSCGRCTRSTSAAWAPAARTSTTSWPSTTATRRRPRRSRTSTSTATRTTPRRWSRRSGWRPSNLVGPASYVQERIAAFKEAGVTHLSIVPATDNPAATIAQVKEWVS